MIPVDQRNGDDCLRAALASLLEIEPYNVPDFVGDHGGAWQAAAEKWLYVRGIAMIDIEAGPGPRCYHLGQVLRPKSREGHAVVMFGSEIVHDPSCTRASSARSKAKGCKPNPMRIGGEIYRLFLLVPIDIGKAMKLGES